MPAEWEPHRATQLHWPSNSNTWPGDRLHKVEQIYVQLITSLLPYEPIVLFVESDVVKTHAQSKLGNQILKNPRLQVVVYPVNDVWVRDCGPVFVRNTGGNPVIIDWEYNAWGKKYAPWENDNGIPTWVGRHLNVPIERPGMILEGGSIDVNGAGVLLTTESVLLNPNRNPGLNKAQIEYNLNQYLGSEQVIWLKRGLAGDDTDGHIDDLTRFLNEHTVLTMICEDPDDVNYSALQENLEILKQVTLPGGNRLVIETLSLPSTRIEEVTVDGSEYVPASYANFYVANGVVLVPLFKERYDEEALRLFKQYFPDRDVIGIPCQDLIWGQGSIHCITQQWI
ncbi:MAG: agmatine deiminase family protein [Bacteroidota bacterium]